MDRLDIAIILVAFVLSVMSARVGCWFALKAFGLDRQHWIGGSWKWIPLVSTGILWIWPVRTHLEPGQATLDTFLAVGIYLPCGTVLAIVVLGAVSKVLSSHKRGPVNKGKPST